MQMEPWRSSTPQIGWAGRRSAPGLTNAGTDFSFGFRRGVRLKLADERFDGAFGGLASPKPIDR